MVCHKNSFCSDLEQSTVNTVQRIKCSPEQMLTFSLYCFFNRSICVFLELQESLDTIPEKCDAMNLWRFEDEYS